MSDGDGEEEIGLADIVVIEEISDIGSEVVGVENPAMVGDGYAGVMFFVALAVEFDEPDAIGIGKLEQRTRGGDKRGGLVVMAVESAEGPVEMWHVESNAEAGADRTLRDSAREVCRPHSGGQREPGNGRELVVDEECRQAARGVLQIGERRTAAVVEHRAERLIVLLVETVHTDLQIIFSRVCGKANLAATSRLNCGPEW